MTVSAIARIKSAQASKQPILYMDNCSYPTLPPEIGQLSNLTHLYLNDNCLRELPSEIGQLSNLIDLDLSSNDLLSLPTSIENLSALESLSMRNNKKLSHFPGHAGKYVSTSSDLGIAMDFGDVQGGGFVYKFRDPGAGHNVQEVFEQHYHQYHPDKEIPPIVYTEAEVAFGSSGMPLEYIIEYSGVKGAKLEGWERFVR